MVHPLYGALRSARYVDVSAIPIDKMNKNDHKYENRFAV